MASQGDTVNTQCLLHGFYVLTYFLLATPEPKLHVTGLPTEPAPDDIRLHDFGLRYQFNLTCLSQIFRTVFAAQHVAHHYNAWTREHRTDSMELFARHAFHCRADVREVARMVRDGARLLQVEEATGSPFVSAIVALNWRQFEASTDAQVRSAFDAMLSRPSVSAIMTILSPQWMYRLFDEYHNFVLHYRKCTDPERTDFMQSVRLQCSSCQLFMQPSTFDAASCFACRRGGYRCPKQAPEREPFLQSSTGQRLYNILSLCRLKGNDCLQRINALPHHDDDTLLPKDGVDVAATPETKLLDMAREIETQLEMLAHLYVTACASCRQRKIKCSLRTINRRPVAGRGGSRSCRPLLPIMEVPEIVAAGSET